MPTSERMCNAVAKLNDLLKFDEFYLPYKGVTIPCWILSTLQGGNNTLMNFIYPQGVRGFGHFDGDACLSAS